MAGSNNALPGFVNREQVIGMIGEALTQRTRPMKIFGLNASGAYAEKVAKHLNMDLTPHEEKTFEDGESYVRSVDGAIGNVRGHNVFVIQSLYSDAAEPVAEKFMKLCIMCGALKTASAHEVIAVVPYLAYARQDRKTESRAPITTKILAKMLQASGVDRVLMMDVHNLSAVQNAFDIRIDILEAKKILAQGCADNKKIKNAKKIRVLSPDKGGLERASFFRDALAKIMGREPEEIPVVIFDKLRKKGVVTSVTGSAGGTIIGDVEDAMVIGLDDMIATGGTMCKAGLAVPKHGGTLAALCATHGLFVGEANEQFHAIHCPIIVADTVAPYRLDKKNASKLQVVDTSPMMANAILRIHSGTGSIAELLD